MGNHIAPCGHSSYMVDSEYGCHACKGELIAFLEAQVARLSVECPGCKAEETLIPEELYRLRKENKEVKAQRDALAEALRDCLKYNIEFQPEESIAASRRARAALAKVKGR